MRKLLVIVAVLVLFALNLHAETANFNETRTITSTHHKFSFTYKTVTFQASHISIYNRGSNSVWCDLNGGTAVVDAADPTTHPLIMEIPAGIAWEDDFMTTAVDCVANGASSSKISVQGRR